MLQLGNVTDSTLSHWSETGISSDLPQFFFLERYAAAYVSEMNSFLSALNGEGGFSPTAREGLEALRLSEAAVLSLNTGGAVSMQDYTPGD